MKSIRQLITRRGGQEAAQNTDKRSLRKRLTGHVCWILAIVMISNTVLPAFAMDTESTGSYYYEEEAADSLTEEPEEAETVAEPEETEAPEASEEPAEDADTSEPEASEEPSEEPSEAPEEAADPEVSEAPAEVTPEVSEEPAEVMPEVSEAPKEPAEVTPEVSEAPEEPAEVTPEVSVAPEEPAEVTPEVSEAPEEPAEVTPEVSVAPEEPAEVTPEVSEAPETPETPEVSEAPAEPEEPEVTEDPTDPAEPEDVEDPTDPDEPEEEDKEDPEEAEDPDEDEDLDEMEDPDEEELPEGDPNADLETAADWEATFANVELTGNWGEDVIAIAKTQLGYHESTENFIAEFDEDGEIVKRGYNRYAAWYHSGTSSYGDWCAMFCSFCYFYADVPESEMPEHSGVPAWIKLLKNRGQYADADSGYVPSAGDLIFFDNDEDGTSDHVALVSSVSGNVVYTIEGNYNDAVAQASHALSDSHILGYGQLPENPDYEGETHTQTAEADGYIVTAVYTDKAGLPEDAVLQVTVIDPASEEFISRAAEYETATGETMDFLLDISFCVDGAEVEPAAPVQITICFADDQAAEYADPSIVHFNEETDAAEVIDSTPVDENDETSFVLDSFSLVAGTWSNGITYDLSDDGVLTISGTGTMPFFASKSSTPWYSQNTSIKEIVVGEGITSIGNYLFYGCSNVTKATLPSTLLSIGMYSFYGCSSLASIDIPSGVTSIGRQAFEGCSSLASIDIPSGVTSIGRDAFDGCSSLTSVVIPEGVTALDSYTFYNCTSLASVTLPDGLTELGSGVFYNCKALTSLTLPDSLITLGSSCFYNCSSLTSLTLPDSLITLGSSCFYNCSSLTSLTLPESLTTLKGSNIFYRTGLTDIYLPASVNYIYSQAFNGCGSMKVHISDLAAYCSINFTKYDAAPSYYTKSLYLNDELITDLVIPEGVTAIPTGAFTYDTALTSVEIPEGVTTIGVRAFEGCTKLTTLTLPSSLTTFGERAFDGCKAIKTIYFDGTATQWAQLDKTNLYEGGYGYSSYYTSSGWGSSALTAAVYVKNDAGEYVLYDPSMIDMTGLTSIPPYCFYGCTSMTSLDIPDTVTSIGKYAFANCSNLTSVKLPSGITSIETYTFSNSGLMSIEIPEGVTSIGDWAFSYCKKLVSVSLPSTLKTLGGYVFYSDAALSSITLPEGLTSIGGSCFYSSGITDLVIPDSVTSLGRGVYGPSSITLGKSLTTIPDDILNCAPLETITIRCANLTTISSTGTSSKRRTLILDDTVDSISQSAADRLAALGYINITFNGPNQLVLPNMTSSSRSFAAGTYYVDAAGALYLLDTENKTAKLIMLQDGAENYTIPAFITGDGDIAYAVTEIASNAFQDADTLKTLTIEDPETLTAVDDMAFAGAENLESINGHTKASEILALFADDADIGILLFMGTKIEDDSTGSCVRGPITTKYSLGGDDVVVVSVSPNNEVNNAQCLNNDTDDLFSQFYTGAGYATTLLISNSVNMQDASSDAVIRVYAAFDASEGSISPVASASSYTVTTTDGVSIPYKVTEVCSGIYCLEIAVNDILHKTAEVSFTLTYPNGSAGGAARIWTEISEGDASDITQASTADYQMAEWTTKPNEYQVSKTSSYTSLAFTVSNGTAYVNSAYYTISSKQTSTRAASYGSDIVTATTYEDVLTLDEDMAWAPGVLEAVRQGHVSVKNPNAGVSGARYDERNIYANLDDGSQVLLAHVYYSESYKDLSFSNVSAHVTKDANGNDTIACTWTYQSTTAQRGDRMTEIQNPTTSLETGNRAIILNKDLEAETPDLKHKYYLTNSVDETKHYLYSEDKTSSADCVLPMQLSNYQWDFQKKAKEKDNGIALYYGSDCTYYLELSNGGNMPYTDFDTVYDDLDTRYYISAANLYKMLTDSDWGEYLEINISNACFETSAFTPTSVTLVTGAAAPYATNTQDSGYATHYGDSGSEGWSTKGDNLNVSENPGNFTTGSLKLFWQDGACWLQKDEESPIAIDSAAALDSALDSMGFFVSASTQYKVTWTPRRNEGDTTYTIPGNTTYKFYIYATMKDTFMMLTQDHETEYSSSSKAQTVPNTAYMTTESGTKRSSTTINVTYNQDFTIKKSALLNGEETTTAGVGDVVTYKVAVTDAGSHSYEVLPWTDCMTGCQVLLAPVSGNEALADLGLTVFTDSEGTEYYELTEGTYSDVWVGGKCADTVKVTASGGEYRTLIYWYFTGVLPTTTISYPALVLSAPNSEGYDEKTGFSLGNVTWLGDHQGHRIFAPINISGHNMYHDKSIVTGTTESGEDELVKYSTVKEGETVKYRLDIENRGGDSYTVYSSALSDTLPLSLKATDGSWDWLWSKDNVKLSYSSSKGEDGFTVTNPDSWYINDGASANAAETAWQQTLYWNEDFCVVVEPNTTLYIYVELTFPENSGTDDYWSRYCEMNAGSDIQNTFNFLDMTDVVTHELGESPEVQLQKGVLSTSRSYSGGDKNTALYTYENGKAACNSNWLTAYQYAPQRAVTYYAVVANAGDTRLYLEELQDVLPKGFLPYAANTAVVYANILTSGNVKLDPDLKLLTDTSKVKVSASGSWDSSDNRATLYFKLTLDEDHYNSENGHYYLLPGEAIGFTYTVYTASASNTEDVAVNTIGMSYYNYYNEDIVVSDAEITGLGKGSASSAGTFTPNDGGCDVYAKDDAAAMGFKTSRTTNLQWLTSSVSLTRGKIVPGIQKVATKATSSGGSVTQNPTVVHDGDKVTWKVTLMNDGSNTITGYTLTDTIKMYEDDEMSEDADSSGAPGNRFIGDIYCSAYSTSSPLFTIKSWSEDGTTATVLWRYDGARTYSTSTLKLNSGSTARAEIHTGSISYGGSYSWAYTYYFLELSTDADNNMVLTISTSEGYMTPGSKIEYYITTEQASGKTRYGEIVNNASLKIGQTYDPDDVIHDDDTDGDDTTVTWSDSVWILSNHMTHPEIQVTETADTTNYGIGSKVKNHIVLPERDSEFYYTLSVNNSTNYSMEKLVLINNLPEVGDSDTYNVESKRDSAFKVVLDPRNTAFTVTVTDSSGNVTVLDPKYYTIEFSTGTNFAAASDDWKGDITDDDTWIAQSDWTGDYDTIRSIRVVITDPATKTEDLSLIPKKSVVSVEFAALVDDPYAMEDGKYIAQDRTIAWDTFGYRYWMPETSYLFAGSRKVGIEIPSVPYIQKKMVGSDGTDYVMPEDETFRILIYEGEAIDASAWNADDLKTTLKDKNFTVVDITVKKGETASDVLRLDSQYAWTVDDDGNLVEMDRSEDANKWHWTTDATYTAVEILHGDQVQAYTAGWEGSAESSLTFTDDDSRVICVNTRTAYPITLPRTGGSGTRAYTLSGLLLTAFAAFALAAKRRRRRGDTQAG